MGDLLDQHDVEKAKNFWTEEDVDQVFSWVSEYLDHLKRVVKKNTATDKEYVQAFRLLETLDYSSSVSLQDQDSSVVQVVIGSGELLPAEFSHQSSPSPSGSPPPPIDEPGGLVAPPAGREELLPPLAPVQLDYKPHSCSKVCLSRLPRMPQSTPPFWGQNPLKVPLLCGFKRLSAMPLMSSPGGEGGWDEKEADWSDWDVIYKTPCGQSLRNYDDVMCFLVATESYDMLQVDFFTFNPSIQLDPPPAPGPHHPEQDLSRGAEPTPVELCVGVGGARPANFRYRKDRWPHGCFLSRGPTLFHACCDCDDGCSDVESCACIAMTTGGRGYSHHRLLEAVPSGLFECGPWCDCNRSRCQNRLVQRGIRVRLQVFQTADRGWGVRCRDDLDRGTFVCIYAGVVLQRAPSPNDLPPPKLSRADFPSDDEVEVVTEWLAPSVLEGRGNLLETPPPVSPATPLHVPVIQRPAECNAAPPELEKVQVVMVGGPESSSPPAGDLDNKKVATTTAAKGVNGELRGSHLSLKRAAVMEDVCFVDGSKEGNVSRFINTPGFVSELFP
ncbi:histone-lysine N-methyltransferase SETDB2 isoform X2 [Melanotaenia boesemani]|uniref:histone-lysine N-methyltransferase SETDB2 isoform X2 n=1 Tax=Melanotaenia boesemani TaxID=1250792 RepID=UPI001C0425AF|nr:histone-lysine N-methyltransferase SETDB2 isoform X2 [Melanotaenia boesemani]